MMKPSEKHMNDAIEGFEEPLGANAEQVVCFMSMSGLLSEEKYLPIRYFPLQVELELVTHANDAFAPGGAIAHADFELRDVQLKVDVVTLENWLDNAYAQHLLSGKSLPINSSTFPTSSQVIPNLNTLVNVSRALTRLKSVFVSFSHDAGSRREVSILFHPMAGAYLKSRELCFEMQIGANLFYQLRKALGLHSVNAQMAITPAENRDNKFVIGIDTEKVLGASFCGYNSKAGDSTVLH